MRLSAFTLIELLVVIVIITVLIGFLMAPFVGQIPFFLLFGWIWGLCRAVAGLVHEPAAVLFGIVLLCLLPTTLHFFIAPICIRFETKWSFRRSVLISLFLVFVSIAGISTVAGIHDALWLYQWKEPFLRVANSGRSAARRMQSVLRLKQIGLGVHNYHDNYSQQFPFGSTLLEDGSLGHGWMTRLLPFCEQPKLYEKIDLSKPWNAPENFPAFKDRVHEYESPYFFEVTDRKFWDRDGYAKTDFSGNQHVLPVGRSFRFDEISDGSSNTLLAGEITGNPPAWGSPLNCRDPRFGINRSPFGFGSKHHGGMNFVLCDGAVKFFSDATDPKVLEALATPSGGEEVPPL